MAIKDPLMFITIEEFKNWKGFNKLEFDDTTTPDNEIWFAISVASNNIDYLSGYSISKKWPETKLTEFTDEVQTATAYYVRFLLTKDSNYIRGQSSISQGGMTYSENNPNEPYYIVPEVFNCLRKIKEYPNITGFNLDVLPKRNDFFSNFYSNCGEDSPFTRYLELINLKTNDTRVKIYPKHPKHLIGSELWIDTTGIKSSDSHSLWELDKDNINFVKLKDDKGIIANNKRIINVGTPKFLSDATTKVYVDNLLDKKQDKLIAGENIKIDKETNTISATGGKTDLSDYYKKEEIDKKLEYKMDKNQFKYAFSINSIGTEIPSLETTNKTVVSAINENKSNIDKKQDKENWKIIGKSTSNREYGDFKLNFNKLYRTIITWEKPPFNQVNIKIKVEFKTGKYLGGNPGDKIFLTKGEIEGVEANLYLIVVKGNNWKLIINGGNKEYANIFSLEELQDTIKIDIQPKLQIRSGSLTTNEVEENIWDIELKNNPTPTPTIPNWKEVGTIAPNYSTVNYNFKVNKLYRLSFTWQAINIKKTVIQYLNFYVETEKVEFTILATMYQPNNQDWRLCMSKDLIAVINRNSERLENCIFKLEELQE